MILYVDGVMACVDDAALVEQLGGAAEDLGDDVRVARVATATFAATRTVVRCGFVRRRFT